MVRRESTQTASQGADGLPEGAGYLPEFCLGSDCIHIQQHVDQEVGEDVLTGFVTGVYKMRKSTNCFLVIQCVVV